MEHKDQLPSVEAFILEVQRHSNITPNSVPHGPKEDFHFKGYIIPKGTFTLISLDSDMTDPEIFPDLSLVRRDFSMKAANIVGNKRRNLFHSQQAKPSRI